MEDIPNTNTGDKPASPADGVRGLLDAGVEIAGAAVSGAVGFLAGGPAVAAVLAGGGALATMALRRIGQEISERYLAPPREGGRPTRDPIRARSTSTAGRARRRVRRAPLGSLEQMGGLTR